MATEDDVPRPTSSPSPVPEAAPVTPPTNGFASGAEDERPGRKRQAGAGKNLLAELPEIEKPLTRREQLGINPEPAPKSKAKAKAKGKAKASPKPKAKGTGKGKGKGKKKQPGTAHTSSASKAAPNNEKEMAKKDDIDDDEDPDGLKIEDAAHAETRKPKPKTLRKPKTKAVPKSNPDLAGSKLQDDTQQPSIETQVAAIMDHLHRNDLSFRIVRDQLRAMETTPPTKQEQDGLPKLEHWQLSVYWTRNSIGMLRKNAKGPNTYVGTLTGGGWHNIAVALESVDHFAIWLLMFTFFSEL